MYIKSSLLLLWVLPIVIANRLPFGGVDGADCVVQERFDSPYVKAVLERVRIEHSSSCTSRETGNHGEEIHVVNVLNNNNHKRITLNINTLPNIERYHGQVKFVLLSDKGVEWQIQYNRETIANDTRILLWMTKESRMYPRRGTQGLNVKVKKFELGHMSTSQVADWVREKTRNMTTYVEISNPDTVPRFVGIDRDAPAACRITSNFSSPVSYEKDQNISGCAAVENERYLTNQKHVDVHVIELLHADSISSDDIHHDVILNIGTLAKKIKNVHLVLVLKSDQKTNWVLRSSGVRGTVQIRTNREVNVDQLTEGSDWDVMQVAFDSDARDYTGESLIRWTRRTIGPPVSYTRAELANKFELIIDGADSTNIIAPASAVTRPPSQSPFDDPQHTLDVVRRSQIVQCSRHKVFVFLEKSKMQDIGITRAHLTLRDERCTARENATHFVLKAKVEDCGTQLISTNDGDRIYKNAIVIQDPGKVHHYTERDDDNDDIDFSGSGINVYPPDDTHVDDEDYTRTDNLNSPFQCGTKPVQELMDGVDIRLNVYKNPNRHRKIKGYPTEIESRQTLYAMVEARGDDKLEPLIHTCWIADSKTETPPEERVHLITNGCVESHGHQEFEDTRSGRQRFEFEYRAQTSGQIDGYLQCQVTLCSKDEDYKKRGFIQCQPQSTYCGARLLLRQQSLFKTLYTGPFHIRSGIIIEPPVDEDDPPDSEEHTDKKRCESEIIQVEGLDSGTVVGIAFAAFVIGVLLTAALWYIHTHTGQSGLRSHRSRSAETSGDSTPSSTAPIHIHHVNHH